MNGPPLSSDRAARRNAILHAAVRTFAEHGFFASRTRDIAAAAGVAEGTIYLYFDGKDDLLLTAFRENVDEFCRSLGEILAGDVPFQERLRRFIEAQFRSIETDPALATVLLLESRQSAKFYGGSVSDVLRRYATEVDSLLRCGVEQGAVRSDLDVPMARRILVGALEEIELGWLLGDRARPLSASAASVADTLFQGFAPRSTPA